MYLAQVGCTTFADMLVDALLARLEPPPSVLPLQLPEPHQHGGGGGGGGYLGGGGGGAGGMGAHHLGGGGGMEVRIRNQGLGIREMRNRFLSNHEQPGLRILKIVRPGRRRRGGGAGAAPAEVCAPAASLPLRRWS